MRDQAGVGFRLPRRGSTFWWGHTIAQGVVLVLLLGLLGCQGRPVVDMEHVRDGDSPGDQIDSRPVLRIAVAARISPESTCDLYDALLDLVADRVGRRAVFSQRRTYAEVNAMVEAKDVDLAFVCAGPYTKGHDDFGMELLVVPVVRGEALYRSYILVAKSGPLKNFDDLRGRKFAFTDPDSNTGCLVPTFMVTERGETPNSFFSETFFTHSHDASIHAVAEGQADGAAVDSLVWDHCNLSNSVDTSRTRIIERSQFFGIPPVVVHPQLDEELKEDLRQAFFHLHEDPEARNVLQGLEIERFARGDDSAYDSVREMQRWVSQDSGLSE